MKRGSVLQALAVVLTALIFVGDLFAPLGVPLPMLYVIPLLVGLWVEDRWFSMKLAGFASVLTLIDPWLAQDRSLIWLAATNRSLTLLIVWITAGGVTRYKGSELARTRAEASLQRTLKELSDVKYALDQSAIVATTDVRGIITYANDKFCEISKYSRAELLGQDHRIVNSGYHPKEFMRELWHTIASGRIWRGEIRNRAKDGTFYWVDTTIVPFLDRRGKPYQYMAIRSDITERKQAEERLREQAALARLGEMAAVVAHEVKNPLAGIRGALQIIGSRLPRDGREQAVIGEIVGRLDALNEMVQDLLVFARPREPKLAPVPLMALVHETAALVKRGTDFANVEVRVRGDDLTVPADAELLRVAFQNLLLNGAQAMSGRGCIDVAVTRNDRTCTVAFTDAGPGIPPDVRARMFEPFFTTKHRGTGLGLAVARRVVGLHGGDIEVVSPPEGGTTMRVHLPRAVAA